MFAHHGYEVKNLSFFDLGIAPSVVATPEFLRPRWTQLFSWSFLHLAESVPDWNRAIERDRFTMDSFHRMLDQPRPPGSPPRFVFLHLLLPHSPIRYDEHGNVRTEPIPSQMVPALFQQILYTEKIATNLVASVLAKWKVPPVIIIQGDHGLRYAGYEETFHLLSAFLLPGGIDRFLYPGITPVNYFRLIARHYLGLPIELAPDLHQQPHAPANPWVSFGSNEPITSLERAKPRASAAAGN
jgi:hypothetical protein